MRVRLVGIVCLLAAMDFIGGYAFPPENRELAGREGWIWVKESRV